MKQEEGEGRQEKLVNVNIVFESCARAFPGVLHFKVEHFVLLEIHQSDSW